MYMNNNYLFNLMRLWFMQSAVLTADPFSRAVNSCIVCHWSGMWLEFVAVGAFRGPGIQPNYMCTSKHVQLVQQFVL